MRYLEVLFQSPGPEVSGVLALKKGTFVAPNPLLKNFASLLLAKDLEGPVLDLACGEGENGLFLAGLGLPVIHYFEGLLENPSRAMARIVCRKLF